MKHTAHGKNSTFKSVDISALVSPTKPKAAKGLKINKTVERRKQQEHRPSQANGQITPGSGNAMASQDI